MTSEEKAKTHYDLVEFLNATCEPKGYAVAYERTKSFLAENPDDGNAHYMFASACYWLSYTRKEVLIEAERAFLKCLELSPNRWDFQMTVFHLGFVYLRQKQYQKALTLVEQRESDFFNSIDQFWRVAKLHEVELSCHYYLQPDKLSLNAAEELEKTYARFEETDNAPLLIEIGDCLSHLLENTSGTNSELEKICCVISRIIRHLDQSDTLRERDGLFFQRLQ